MGKTYERIDGRLRAFIEAQPLFFTATAPLAGDGTVNLSPKGLQGSFAVLDELTVAYLDFAGSNAETISHLRENGRITLMWCAFQGPPNIVLRAELIRDSCGYAVPYITYDEDRDLHRKRFAREDHASLSAYLAKKEH